MTSRLTQHPQAGILQPEPSQRRRPLLSTRVGLVIMNLQQTLWRQWLASSRPRHLSSGTTVNLFMLVPPAPRRSGTCCQTSGLQPQGKTRKTRKEFEIGKTATDPSRQSRNHACSNMHSKGGQTMPPVGAQLHSLLDLHFQLSLDFVSALKSALCWPRCCSHIVPIHYSNLTQSHTT